MAKRTFLKCLIGRLISIKIANDAVGETWRYGTLRIDARPDGRR